MPCYRPLQGFRAIDPNDSGKFSIVFNPRYGYKDLPVQVPCGQCIGCRLERSRQWAMRCIHEAQMHEENCFITLTYNEENLPPEGSLVKYHFQKFMKRLRKEVAPKKIRFFHCGEYGEKLKRPHYHACIFGLDFKDKISYSNGNGVTKSSPLLEKLWPYGFNTVGELTFESAAYVARYILKKINGDQAIFHYSDIDMGTGEIKSSKEPEYVTMSRRPGIGAEWFKKYQSDVFPSDSVIVRGKEMKPPKFYDSKYEIIDGEAMKKIKIARQEKVKRANVTEERLRVREHIMEHNQKNQLRSYENDSQSVRDI